MDAVRRQVVSAIRRDMFMVTPTSVLAPFLMGLFLIVLPASAQSTQIESDRGVWRTAAPAPTKRTEVAAVMLYEKIYVVGDSSSPDSAI